MKKKGAITNTGYLPNSPDRFNDFNIIPSSNITMRNVPFPIMAIPNNYGPPRIMYPGENHMFPGSTMVKEIPMPIFQTPEDFYRDALIRKRDQYWNIPSSGSGVPWPTDNMPARSGPGPIPWPTVKTNYQGVAMQYGGDPYPSSKYKMGGWLDTYQNGGTPIHYTSEAQYQAGLLNKNKSAEQIAAEREWVAKRAAAQKAQSTPVKKAEIKAKETFGVKPVERDKTYVHPTYAPDTLVPHHAGPYYKGPWYWEYRNPIYDHPIENTLEYVPYVGTVLGVNDWMDSVYELNSSDPKSWVRLGLETSSLAPLGRLTTNPFKKIALETLPQAGADYIAPYQTGGVTINSEFAKGGSVDADTAKRILKSGSSYGRRLSSAQRRYFAEIAGTDEYGNEPEEQEQEQEQEDLEAMTEYGRYKKGGLKRGRGDKYTSKNIKSSINEILYRRNEDLYGPKGKKYFKPYQDGGQPAAPMTWDDYADQYFATQQALAAEQARVAQVRGNVIPAAQALDQADNSLSMASINAFNKMKEAANPKEFQSAIAAYPQELRNVLPAGGRYNIAEWDKQTGTWDPYKRPSRELYCTPYGCFNYQKAGASDVPIVGGNMGFQAGAQQGTLPFKKIPASEAQPGDMALIVGTSPSNYTDPNPKWVTRAHHTTVLAEPPTLNNSGKAVAINAYNAADGARLQYGKTDFKTGNPGVDSFEFYRYVGNTPALEQQAQANRQQMLATTPYFAPKVATLTTAPAPGIITPDYQKVYDERKAQFDQERKDIETSRMSKRKKREALEKLDIEEKDTLAMYIQPTPQVAQNNNNMSTPQKKQGGIAFPQQPTEERFFERGYVPNSPVGFYAMGGPTDMIAFPQQPPADMFFSGYPFQPQYMGGGSTYTHYNMGGIYQQGAQVQNYDPNVYNDYMNIYKVMSPEELQNKLLDINNQMAYPNIYPQEGLDIQKQVITDIMSTPKKKTGGKVLPGGAHENVPCMECGGAYDVGGSIFGYGYRPATEFGGNVGLEQAQNEMVETYKKGGKKAKSALMKYMRSMRKEAGGEAPQNVGQSGYLMDNQTTFNNYLKDNMLTAVDEKVANEMFQDGGSFGYNPYNTLQQQADMARYNAGEERAAQSRANMRAMNQQFIPQAYNAIFAQKGAGVPAAPASSFRSPNPTSEINPATGKQWTWEEWEAAGKNKPQESSDQYLTREQAKSFLEDYMKNIQYPQQNYYPQGYYPQSYYPQGYNPYYRPNYGMGYGMFPYNPTGPYYKTKFKGWSNMPTTYNWQPGTGYTANNPTAGMTPEQIQKYWGDKGFEATVQQDIKSGLLHKIAPTRFAPRRVKTNVNLKMMPGQSGSSSTTGSSNLAPGDLSGWHPPMAAPTSLLTPEQRNQYEMEQLLAPNPPTMANGGKSEVGNSMGYSTDERRRFGIFANPSAAPWMIGALDYGARLGEIDEQQAMLDRIKSRQGADANYYAQGMKKGDYTFDPYAGQSFRPDQMGAKVQPGSMGNIGAMNLGNFYQSKLGGESDYIYMDDNEIADFMAKGGTIEYLD